jgi:uncharacterized protein HemX
MTRALAAICLILVILCLLVSGYAWYQHDRARLASERAVLLEREAATVRAQRDRLREQVEAQNEAVDELARAAERVERAAAAVALRELDTGAARRDAALAGEPGPERMNDAMSDLFRVADRAPLP